VDVVSLDLISITELTFTLAICCRPSVCRLSVCNARAPYSCEAVIGSKIKECLDFFLAENA